MKEGKRKRGIVLKLEGRDDKGNDERKRKANMKTNQGENGLRSGQTDEKEDEKE